MLCPGGMTANVTIGPGDAPGKYIIYAASWDGRLHKLNAADGEALAPPAKFMPPNGKPYALNLVNNVIYTHSGAGLRRQSEHGLHLRSGHATKWAAGDRRAAACGDVPARPSARIW